MNQLNILFLGGAKRVAMARLFKKAAARRGYDCCIFSYELSKQVPIACEAEVIKGTLWRDPAIYELLMHEVAEHSISIIVPFVDPSISIAARVRDLMRDRKVNVYVPTGGPLHSDDMLDKVVSARTFKMLGLDIPTTHELLPSSFPVIAKPRYGSASKGIIVINNIMEWDAAHINPHKYLIQDYIADREEYTVDCFVDSKGSITACQPRLRVATAGGEVTETVTVDSREIVEASVKALTRLGLRGAVTLQYLRDLSSGRLMLMEINPRLGGGAVVTVYAGADLPGMIIDDATKGSAGSPVKPVADVRMTRYMQEVVFMPKLTMPLANE